MVEEGIKKRVVILGAGTVGGLLARNLSSVLNPAQYTLTVVNDRPFYVHLFGTTRISVSDMDNLEDQALFGFEALLRNGNGSVKIGKAVAIEETAPGKGGNLVLEDGERVPYDTLVLATGSIWPDFAQLPQTLSEARAHIRSWRAKIEKAQHVVVIGGGPVGMEFSGEIRYAFPEKKVTLMHRSAMVLNAAYPDHFRQDLQHRASLRGIEIIVGDTIEDLTERPANGVTTKNGKHLPDVDLVIPVFGSRPNTEMIKTLGEGVVNASGYVNVTEHLEVPGHPGVYAVGDIVHWDEQKQAYKGDRQSYVVRNNLLRFLQGEPPTSVYKGTFEALLIPLGKSGGAAWMGILWGLTFGDWYARNVKGKDLLTAMMRRKRGL